MSETSSSLLGLCDSVQRLRGPGHRHRGLGPIRPPETSRCPFPVGTGCLRYMGPGFREFGGECRSSILPSYCPCGRWWCFSPSDDLEAPPGDTFPFFTVVHSRYGETPTPVGMREDVSPRSPGCYPSSQGIPPIIPSWSEESP